ncbi:MAG: short-chain fatty acyl-CoA regulator family protein, partial [Myxococcota bacterium]
MMQGAVRRFDPRNHILRLAEVLPPRSRNFQLAYQIAFLDHADLLERLTRDPGLTSEVSRRLGRIALGNYFAAAVMMPYDRFRSSAQALRYDVQLLGHRFRTSFEQVCHRLTTLKRPGAEGIPFHLVRIDVAGNISKRFSASGFRFARFSGACPRWNEHTAFLTPGLIRRQIAEMPDGARYFCVARTVRDELGGYHAPHALHAVGLGCEVRFAPELIYADGVDLTDAESIVPIGVTCRVCDRMDCEQRAFPSMMQPLNLDEQVRGRSLYVTVPERE